MSSMKWKIGLVTQMAALLLAWDASAAPKFKRIIVTGSDVNALKQEARGHSGEVDHDMYYMPGFVARMSPERLEKFKARLAAKFGNDVVVEEDAIVTADAQTRPWGISRIKAREANVTERGYGTLVCVADTGIQPDHPDLKANIAGGENFVARNGVIDPRRWADDKGHGTHVAGTIAAINNTYGVVGVAPSAKLFAAKVLDSSGSGFISDVSEGIVACADAGADVINMSLSTGSSSTTLYNAIKYARSRGVVIVAAAGNNASVVRYPAKYPEVVAVSAVDKYDDPASFTNRGPEVDFAAPGVSVYSTYIGGRYAYMSGTSMAAPHVAGVAALWIGSGSLGMVGVDIGLHDYYQGDGLINAFETVTNF